MSRKVGTAGVATYATTMAALAAASRKLLWEERHPGEVYPKQMSHDDAADTVAEILQR